MFEWLRSRSPGATFAIGLCLGPSIAMLYIGRWRHALVYLALVPAALTAGFVTAWALPGDQPAPLISLGALALLQLVGAAHARLLALRYAVRPGWYSRWPVIGGAWIAAPALLLTLFNVFGAQVYTIPGLANGPTLVPGDVVLVAKWPYGYSRFSGPLWPWMPGGQVLAHEPRPGDLVLFRLPMAPQMPFLSRVVAGPRDWVSMQDGTLVLNERPVPTATVGAAQLPDGRRGTLVVETLPGGVRHEVFHTRRHSLFDDTDVTVVPPRHYFMLSDNRDDADDSRGQGVGPIPADHIVGRVDLVLWNEATDTFPWGRLAAFR